MLKVFLYSEAEIHLYNVHWLYLKPPKIHLRQPSGFVLDILSQFAAVCSGGKEMRSGSQPGTLSPTFRAPQKSIFRLFPVRASIRPLLPLSQPGACEGASPSQGLPLTFLHLLTSFMALLVLVFANVKSSVWEDDSASFARHRQAVMLRNFTGIIFTDHGFHINSAVQIHHMQTQKVLEVNFYPF